MYQEFINLFWDEYKKVTPSASIINQLLEDKQETIHNDHIAFRTVNLPEVSLSRYGQLLAAYGYFQKGDYIFEKKKLVAKHFEHSDPSAPKIFVSELQVQDFSDTLQNTTKEIVSRIPLGLLSNSAFSYSGRTWGTISHQKYQDLLKESEYAAWFYVFGFCANHFTININQLKTIEDLQAFNSLLKKEGFTINSSGGEIKGSPEELLEQSSIMADKLMVQFAEGSFSIPSCYYEFAKRYPTADGKLYNGFIAKSADKIFESTNVKDN